MIPFKTINDLINKHSLLEKELSTGEIDKNSFAEKSKEYADLNEIIQIAKFYISFEKNKKEIQLILEDKNSDTDMIKMAENELIDLEKKKEKNEKKLKLFLLPKMRQIKNAIIEIRAGTGGLEASLFASDLFKMCEKLAKRNGALN